MIFFVSLHKNSLQTSKMTEINQYRQELKDRIISYAMGKFSIEVHKFEGFQAL